MSIRLLVNEYLKMNGKYENESLEFGAQIRWITLRSKNNLAKNRQENYNARSFHVGWSIQTEMLLGKGFILNNKYMTKKCLYLSGVCFSFLLTAGGEGSNRFLTCMRVVASLAWVVAPLA